MGHTRSMYTLGTYYENATGAIRDLDHAILLYQKAAYDGNAQAQQRLQALAQNIVL